LRASEPVQGDQRNGLWGITRHADLMFVEPNIFARAVRSFNMEFRPRGSV
jgi:hypothetical protein